MMPQMLLSCFHWFTTRPADNAKGRCDKDTDESVGAAPRSLSNSFCGHVYLEEAARLEKPKSMS